MTTDYLKKIIIITIACIIFLTAVAPAGTITKINTNEQNHNCSQITGSINQSPDAKQLNDNTCTCPKCSGSGKCWVCSGTGSTGNDNCTMCSGTGKCWYCTGKGNI